MKTKKKKELTMKRLVKILSVAAILGSFASANMGAGISLQKGLQDKQEVTIVSLAKNFGCIGVGVGISNKTYKDYSISLNFKKIEGVDFNVVGGHEIYNARTQERTNQRTQEKETIDIKKRQTYLGLNAIYNVNKSLKLYEEIDLGSKSLKLKLGMQHHFTKSLSAGMEYNRRWSLDDKYDNTNNVLFNVSYTF